MRSGFVWSAKDLLCISLLACCMLVIMTMYGYRGVTAPARSVSYWKHVARPFSSPLLSESSNDGKHDVTMENKRDEGNEPKFELLKEPKQAQKESLKNADSIYREIELSHKDHLFLDTGLRGNKVQTYSKDVVEALGNVLAEKLFKAKNNTKEVQFRPTCYDKATIANSCDKKCLQTNLPNDPRKRVAQLVQPSRLHLTSSQHVVLRDIADKVKGYYDVILLTAASSNHYLESQALLHNLHQMIFPQLNNFTLILYNLGLTKREKAMMNKYCRCQVMDFPFAKFPDFMKDLNSFSWKPVLIKAHLQKANIVVWMDASVRFEDSRVPLTELLDITRERGLQIGGSSVSTPTRSFRSMYHFFGDEPCAHKSFGMAKATFGAYHHEYFVDRAVLEPWVACALNPHCMGRARHLTCSTAKKMKYKYENGLGPLMYGLCHRFDQSAISIILHKLYQGVFKWVMCDLHKYMMIRRDETMIYFPRS